MHGHANKFQCHLPGSGVAFGFTLVTNVLLRTATALLTGLVWAWGPILDDFQLARFSAADFGPNAQPGHLPQLFDFFWNETECIVAARAM